MSDPSVEDSLYMIDKQDQEFCMKISTRFYTFYTAKDNLQRLWRRVRESMGTPFQKPSIGGEKPSIGGEKPSIDELLARLRLTQPTRENIKKLASALKDGEIFGRSRIMEIVGLSNGPAGDMINTMLRNGLLDSVRGHGKGKYRFRI